MYTVGDMTETNIPNTRVGKGLWMYRKKFKNINIDALIRSIYRPFPSKAQWFMSALFYKTFL